MTIKRLLCVVFAPSASRNTYRKYVLNIVGYVNIRLFFSRARQRFGSWRGKLVGAKPSKVKGGLSPWHSPYQAISVHLHRSELQIIPLVSLFNTPKQPKTLAITQLKALPVSRGNFIDIQNPFKICPFDCVCFFLYTHLNENGSDDIAIFSAS